MPRRVIRGSGGWKEAGEWPRKGARGTKDFRGFRVCLWPIVWVVAVGFEGSGFGAEARVRSQWSVVSNQETWSWVGEARKVFLDVGGAGGFIVSVFVAVHYGCCCGCGVSEKAGPLKVPKMSLRVPGRSFSCPGKVPAGPGEVLLGRTAHRHGSLVQGRAYSVGKERRRETVSHPRCLKARGLPER